MDEALARKLLRQVRLLNILIISSTMLFIGMFVAGGFFGYMAYKEVRDARHSLTSLGTGTSESTDELQQQLCSSGGTLGSLLNSQSDICD